MSFRSARWVLLLAALAAGCGRHAPPRIVVWIEVDTLRADALGCYGNHSTGAGGRLPSPRIDALAADGLRFEHAYASAPAARASLSTQLTGQWPWEEAPATTLVARIRELGWRSAGVSTDPALPGAQGLERWDAAHASSPEALAQLLAQADELARDPRQGLFLFGWLSEPRYPFEDHTDLRFGADYSGALHGDEPEAELRARRAELDPQDKLFLRGRYQGEVAFVDRALGAFFDELARRGWYEQALIVLASDHGVELFDHGGFGQGSTLLEEAVHVPWIVKLPAAQAGARKGKSCADVVSLIDLPATLLDWIGARPSAPGGGLLGHSRSLLPLLRAEVPSERRWIYLRTEAEAWGVIDAQTAFKWVVDHGQDPPRGMLFDLQHDPYEQNDYVPRMGAGRAAQMRRLRALVARPLNGARAAPAVLPEEPWIEWPAELDGAGPALLADQGSRNGRPAR